MIVINLESGEITFCIQARPKLKEPLCISINFRLLRKRFPGIKNLINVEKLSNNLRTKDKRKITKLLLKSCDN
jgi:hypothetical protein